ncbi:SusC/RagA family TonB-linked outer membrane protein [Mangrovibacterium diazotrophicum]|uniref:TonB-linked SusC/RagA family outer membrane protein n=1 Tax=Mangrovibacterium diazotrophicum TaxID=1261403 RepID=A0A419W5N3_9BACT|nr:SusC/RagA family TonB-linked outer membrane protein [Mangrovibacterium diazotrophicum]RKD90757.1 TonB-linked SusC/RagA family outer membrane protein [Mangrovibacterium diazotrophicum]
MKKRLLLIIVLVACACLSGRAQEGSVTVQLKQSNLKKIFELIQLQSEYIIFYNDSQVDSKRKVSVSVESGTVNEVLDQALKGTDLSYKIFDRQIIILKEQDSQALSALQSDNLSQENRIIEGNVTDESGNPISGVSVFVFGKSYGVTTNFGGHYLLKIPADTKLLTFSFVGMKTIQESLGADSVLNVVLLPDNFGVEEVVVSALGIQRNERSLSFAQQTIDYEGVSSREYSFVSGLSGKVSGMQVTRSASGAGGSSKVLLRGNKSLSTSSEPLFVIDGIPMVNSKGRQLGLFDGGDQGDGLSQVNSDDIESITVLKGANAAALYGSQGANGVILINTKKGEPGALKVNLSSYFTVETIKDLPELQFDYGSLNGASESWSYEKGNYKDNYVKDFFQTGTNLVNTLSLSGGSYRTTSYFSFAHTSSQGVIPKNKYEKINLTFKQSSNLLEGRLILGSNIMLTEEQVKNKYMAGYYLNPLTGLYFFPRDRDFSQYKENYQVFNADRNLYVQNWFVEDHFQSNPYWIINNEPREDQIKRIIGNVNAAFRFNDHFNLKVRGSYDYAVKTYEEKHKAGSNVTNVHPNGRWVYTKVDDQLIYGDAILFYNDNWEKFSVSAILGTSYQKSTIGQGLTVDTDTDGLLYPNEFYFQNIEDNVIVYSILSSRLIKEAVFGNVQLNYDDKLFLDISGRNDWASSLYGTGNDSYFYPSVGLSGIITDLVTLPEFISYGKLRSSFSRVSNEVPFNRVNPQHSIGPVGVVFNTTKSFENLRPEKIQSYELGTEFKFWKNRFGFDFTYYKVVSLDQFIELPAPSGSGYTTYYVNAGKITNQGTESTVFVCPIRTRNFEWTATFNYSENQNKIVKLSDELKNPIVLSDNEGYQLIIDEGGSFGDLYAYKFERDERGRILLNENGTIRKSERQEYIGNSNPRYNLGLNNRIAYRNLSLDFLIGAKFGGKVISQTESMLDGYGVSKRTAVARDNGAVNINAVLPDGTPVNEIDPQVYYTSVGERSGIKEVYSYSRDNIRLSQIRFSYSFSPENLGIKDIQLSLVGQNLFFLYKSAPFDPEITLNTLIQDQAIDSFSVPSTRSFGLNVKVQF